MSRNEFLKRIEPYNTSDKMDKALYNFAFNKIISCSSVTPKRKMGKWIKHDTGHSIYYSCSLCSCVAPCTETEDKILWKLSNFCPDCGAKNGNGRWEMAENGGG